MANEDKQCLPQDWQLEKSQSESNLCLLQSGLHADVWFRCADQDKSDSSDRVPAHKLILASRSPVFEAMFYGQLAESGSEIELPEIEKNPFLLFLRCLYSDDTELLEDNALDVMQIAHKYQVTTCLKICSQFLTEIIRSDNAARILEYALLFNDQNLLCATSQLIDDNALAVIQSEGFIEISQGTLEYVLKGNLFYAPEVDIIKAVDCWAAHRIEMEGQKPDPINKRAAMANAFFYLRLPSMTPREFMEIQLEYAYLTNEEQVRISKYIIDRTVGPNDLCCSVEERLPRVVTYSFDSSDIANADSESGTETGNQSEMFVGNITLACRKKIKLAQVILSIMPHENATAKCKITNSMKQLVFVSELRLQKGINFQPAVELTASGVTYHINITIPRDCAKQQTTRVKNITINPRTIRKVPIDIYDYEHGFSLREGTVIAAIQEKEYIYRKTQTVNQETTQGSILHPFSLQACKNAFGFITGIRYINISNRH